jgi:hypothetical protein
MDSHRIDDAPEPSEPRDALVERQRVLAAVKFTGLAPPPPVEEPELGWRDRIRSLLFRA